jgi:hypothetical protein
MSEINIGQLITEDYPQKDAIHIAVAPVTAGEKLNPGDHIGFLEGGTVGEVENPIGIVDPFLKIPVKPDQRFWIFLYPKSTKNLRHDWEHPAFGLNGEIKTEEMSASEMWIRSIAMQHHITYEQLIQIGKDFQAGKDSDFYFHDIDLSGKFWEHFESVTKTKVDHDVYVPCAC